MVHFDAPWNAPAERDWIDELQTCKSATQEAGDITLDPARRQWMAAELARLDARGAELTSRQAPAHRHEDLDALLLRRVERAFG